MSDPLSAPSQVYSILHAHTDPAPPPEDGLDEDPTHVSAPPPARAGSLQQCSTLSVVMRTQEAQRDQVGPQGEGLWVGPQGELYVSRLLHCLWVLYGQTVPYVSL